MLSQVKAVRFAQEITTGRNSPLLVGCERLDGSEIEVVMKTDTRECPVGGLIREAWCSMLAADLGLPAPEPFIVEIDSDFIFSIPDEKKQVRKRLEQCEQLAFGSAYVSPGFSTWASGQAVPKENMDEAAEILSFDAFVLNPDRRPANPNCLFDGNSFLIFDHELALNLVGVGGSFLPYPWQPGALSGLTSGMGEHLFGKVLQKKSFNLNRLENSWASLDLARLDQYHQALPSRWATIDNISDNIKSYLDLLNRNLPSAFKEVRRILL
jgi:hypothetical protein